MSSPVPDESPLDPIDLPVCPDCKQPKRPLGVLTEKKKETIFVCAVKAPKSKMPCDGDAWFIARKNSA